jgi:hypothetical protein
VIFPGEQIPKVLARQKTQIRVPVEPVDPGLRQRWQDASGQWHSMPGGGECPFRQGRSYAVQSGRGKRGITRIRVIALRVERHGAMTGRDLQAEGYRSLVAYKADWNALHSACQYDADQEVWVVTFTLNQLEPVRLFGRRVASPGSDGRGHKITDQGDVKDRKESPVDHTLGLITEPEPVNDKTLAEITSGELERRRLVRAKNQDKRLREAHDAVAEELKEIKDVGRKMGVDVGNDVEFIERRLKRIREKLAAAA